MRRFSLLFVFLSFVCVMQTGLALEPSDAPGKDEASQEAGDAARHDFGNFSFEIPKDWKVVKPDGRKTEAMLLLGGPVWYASKGMIKVDAGKLAAPNAKAAAEAFAKSSGGKVASDSPQLDGTIGARVDTGKHSVTEPGILIAVMREDRGYLLMGAAAKDVDLDSAIESIQKSWKWTDSADER